MERPWTERFLGAQGPNGCFFFREKIPLGVEPKIGGVKFPPKWMVKISWKTPMNKWMIWGETPLFWETSLFLEKFPRFLTILAAAKLQS